MLEPGVTVSYSFLLIQMFVTFVPIIVRHFGTGQDHGTSFRGTWDTVEVETFTNLSEVGVRGNLDI